MFFCCYSKESKDINHDLLYDIYRTQTRQADRNDAEYELEIFAVNSSSKPPNGPKRMGLGDPWTQ
jgi:hypothetical protein